MMARTRSTAFSLVEITLALGVAGFCLITAFGLLAVASQTQRQSVQQTTANGILSEEAANLRAAVRYPPGLASKLNTQQQTLKGHWGQIAQPDILYYTNQGAQTGGISPNAPPSDAAFRLTLTYLAPPTQTTSLANLTITWPAQVDPATGIPTGSAQTFIAVNR